MNRSVWFAAMLLAAPCVVQRSALTAAENRAATAAPVELPPMMIEESTSSVPWLYVNAGNTEFLSRCSASTTRRLVQAWIENLELVRAVIPEEFLLQMDVPWDPLESTCRHASLSIL